MAKKTDPKFESPPDDQGSRGGAEEFAAEGSAAIINQFGDELLAIPGVEGLGVTMGPEGTDAVVVYVRDASTTAKIPSILGGLPTTVEVTGQIDALPKP